MKLINYFSIAGILFFSLLRFLYPSDIPFINDEAKLIQQALDFNARGELPVAGLMGSRGLQYGPFAIWFYQLVLLFTGNILVVAVCKMVFVFITTITSLVWISQNSHFSWKAISLVCLLSPYLWFYSRDLWDNCFVIPLSVAFFASYLDFVTTKRTLSLAASVLLLSFGFLTHLVFMPVVASFILHFLSFERGYFKSYPGRVLIIGAAGTAAVAPYLIQALNQRPIQHLEWGNLGHLLMPFTGARFFTALGLEYFIGDTWTAPFASQYGNYLCNALTGISALGYPLTIFGLILITQKALKGSHLERILILSFVSQVALSFAYRLIPIPNFHSAQWFVYLIALLTAVQKVREFNWGRWVLLPYFGSLALGVPAFAILVHIHSGSRFIHYGPTIGNQLEISKRLAEIKTKNTVREAFHASEFPFALDLLTNLNANLEPTRHASTVYIQYDSPLDKRNGRITAKFVE